MNIKKGDNVIYGAYAGEKIAFKESIDNVEYILLFEEDILAFIEFKVWDGGRGSDVDSGCHMIW